MSYSYTKYSIVLISWMAFLFLSFPVFGAEIKLAWDAPTQNEDGSLLTDLEGYRVYYGTSARTGTDPKSCGLCGYSTKVSVGNVTTHTITDLTGGQNYFFSVVGYDFSNNESVFSNELSTYTLSVGVSPSGVGSVARNPDQAIYVYGDLVQLTATASPGYTFSNWSGDASGASNPITITMSGNKTVTANFTISSYTVTASVTGGHGTATPATQNINHGASASINITPDTGYQIASITDNGASQTIANPYVISNVTAAHAVVVTFTINTYAVTASVTGGHGTATPATQNINHGANASINITPDTGYQIASITDNGASQTIANPYVISNVTAAHAVVVTFTINTYAVTASVTGGHGTATPATQNINHGASASINITPDTGYQIASITDNGASQTIANPYVISNVTGTHAVVVTFTINSYTVTASVVGDQGGAVTPSSRTVDHGATATFTVTTNTGYTASVSEGGLTGTTWTIPNVTSSHTVTLNFVYSLTVLLKAGYNLVSFPNLLGETAITELLLPISGKYEVVYAYEGCDTVDHWKIYAPSLAYGNDLQYVDNAMGLWIEANQDTALTVEGLFPSALNVTLCVGWNLISYAGAQAKPVAEALSSISGKYEKVYSYRAEDMANPWMVYGVSAPSYVNDLVTLEPGFGYWIYINENCTLVVTN